MTTHQMTVKTLVEQTIKACNELSAAPEYAEYAVNINRKAEALRTSPTALNAYNVLNDLKVISRMAGTWND